MTSLTICDVCGQRLDGAELETEERHVRAELRFERQGHANVLIEMDFCVECAYDRQVAFEAKPFTDSLSTRPRPPVFTGRDENLEDEDEMDRLA